jgi:hypothetical protein
MASSTIFDIYSHPQNERSMNLPPDENPYKSTNPTLTPDAVASDNSTAKSIVKSPAMALMILSIISIVFSCGMIILNIFQTLAGGVMAGSRGGPDQEEGVMNVFMGVGGIVGQIFSILIYAFFIVGCKKMMALESKGLVWAMLVLAVIPFCSPCCIGLPFGIWGIVVMNNPIVKNAFTS